MMNLTEDDANDIAADCVHAMRQLAWRVHSTPRAKRPATIAIVAEIDSFMSNAPIAPEDAGALSPWTMQGIVERLKPQGFTKQIEEIEQAMEDACAIWSAARRRAS